MGRLIRNIEKYGLLGILLLGSVLRDTEYLFPGMSILCLGPRVLHAQSPVQELTLLLLDKSQQNWAHSCPAPLRRHLMGENKIKQNQAELLIDIPSPAAP